MPKTTFRPASTQSHDIHGTDLPKLSRPVCNFTLLQSTHILPKSFNCIGTAPASPRINPTLYLKRGQAYVPNVNLNSLCLVNAPASLPQHKVQETSAPVLELSSISTPLASLGDIIVSFPEASNNWLIVLLNSCRINTMHQESPSASLHVFKSSHAFFVPF